MGTSKRYPEEVRERAVHSGTRWPIVERLNL